MCKSWNSIICSALTRLSDKKGGLERSSTHSFAVTQVIKLEKLTGTSTKYYNWEDEDDIFNDSSIDNDTDTYIDPYPGNDPYTQENDCDSTECSLIEPDPCDACPGHCSICSYAHEMQLKKDAEWCNQQLKAEDIMEIDELELDKEWDEMCSGRYDDSILDPDDLPF